MFRFVVIPLLLVGEVFQNDERHQDAAEDQVIGGKCWLDARGQKNQV
jgi:hypothetical protein